MNLAAFRVRQVCICLDLNWYIQSCGYNWYRGLSCLLAVLVCISTLTTKQHVVPDVLGGVLLAEICFFIGKKAGVWGTYGRILDKINGKLCLEGGNPCGQGRK